MGKILWADEITLSASLEHLPSLMNWVEERLNKTNGLPKSLVKYRLALEEALVNILNYAYPEIEGLITLSCSFDENRILRFTFKDKGIPFNPLLFHPPKDELLLENRKVGGLGIFLMRKNVDDVQYQHLDGFNILTLSASI